MPTLDDLLRLLVSNQQAAGVFPGDPAAALGRAAAPSAAQFGNVDPYQAARDFLQRGTATPPAPPDDPTSAALLQGQQPGAPVSEGGGAMTASPVGSPDQSLGGRLALSGQLGSYTSLTSLGLMLAGMLAPPPFSLLAPFGKFMMGRANEAALAQGLQGLNIDEATMGREEALAALMGALSEGQMAGPQFSFSGSPTGFVGSTPPAAPSPFGISSVSGLQGFTAPGGVFGGPQSLTLDIEEGMATGVPPGGGPSSGGAGVGAGPSGSGPGEGSGQAPYRGGYLRGPRRKTRTVPRAHGGELVLNATVASKFPELDVLNDIFPPDPNFDRLMDRARGFLSD